MAEPYSRGGGGQSRASMTPMASLGHTHGRSFSSAFCQGQLQYCLSIPPYALFELEQHCDWFASVDIL